MPQNSANITITVNQFRPIGAVFPISAHFQVVAPSTNTAVITSHGKDLTIKFQTGEQTSDVILTYTLPSTPDSPYVLLGIVFGANEAGSQSAGRTEFPAILVNRSTSSSTLQVTDTCNPGYLGVRFNYLILVQNLQTYEIGVIDPDIEDETQPS